MSKKTNQWSVKEAEEQARAAEKQYPKKRRRKVQKPSPVDGAAS